MYFNLASLPARCKKMLASMPPVDLCRFAVLLVLAVAVFFAGRLSAPAPAAMQRAVAGMKLELLHEQQALDQLSRRHAENVDALAARLAELQAASTRLDALGERLVQLGRLDPAEFDFGGPPPLGGPERIVDDGETNVVDLDQASRRLGRTLHQQMTRLEALQVLLLDRDLEQASTPAGWPVRSGWISSGFGERNDPFSGKKTLHEGLDFAGTEGSAVLSVASGVVSWAGRKKGYGNTLEIDHGNGYVTRYAHNERLLAKAGDRVQAGQTVASMGATGRASSPHVHFEVLYRGQPVNPYRFVKQAR